MEILYFGGTCKTRHLSRSSSKTYANFQKNLIFIQNIVWVLFKTKVLKSTQIHVLKKNNTKNNVRPCKP